MNFYKATENLNSDFTKNQHSHHRLPGRYALVEPSNGRPKHGRDTLIFLLQELRFTINLKKLILSATQKLEFLGLEIDSVNMTSTLPMEKVKSLT